MRVFLRRVPFVFAALSLAFTALPAAGAADDVVLANAGGTVTYRASAAGAEQPVNRSASVVVGANATASTGAASQASVTMPDSSVVAMGATTTVQIGNLERAADGSVNGTTITVPASGGTVRFDIRRPSGGKSNYTFRTPTSSISVRGTLGLFTSGGNGDEIVCLNCAAGDVTVTVGTQTYPLLTGQVLFVTLAGVVTVGAITAAILSTFASAGVSTSAVAGASPFAGGAGGAGAAGGGGAVSAGAAAVAVGVVAVAAVAAGNSKSTNNNSNATAQPTAIPTATATPSATPSPAATTNGNGTITGHVRKP